MVPELAESWTETGAPMSKQKDGQRDGRCAYHRMTVAKEYEQASAGEIGVAYRPDLYDLFVVSEETTPPNQPLTVLSWTSGALDSYFLLDIENRRMLGNLDLEGMRVCR